MKIRIASLLLALALPLSAQDPVATETELMFYKAFYLEKTRDFLGAMALYDQFLAKAPEHKLAKQAATSQWKLLDSTGKAKERDAFRAKYEKLLADVPNTPAPRGDAGAGTGERPARGEGEGRGERGERGAGGAGGRPDMAARITELEKQLAKAKEEGNDEEVKRLETALQRAREGGNRAGGPGGQGGRGRGGLMGALMANKKVAEMTAEEMTQLKESLANSGRMVEMVRNGQGGEEAAKKVEANIESLKKALDANKTEDAQKALDALRESFPRRGGRGGGGGEGGGEGGRGRGNGGGGEGGGARGNGGNGGGGGGGGR